ncbi:MAG: alpha/beta fold hydrolase [Acidimicrobiales bacterium]
MSDPPALAAVDTGAGPAVVLLHGQPGTSADWAALVPLLAAGFRVLVPDRPGYGRTGGRPTDFAGNAGAVVALLDRAGVAQAIVVGHSWAGGAAIHLATGAPGRVAGLVLAASVGPEPPSLLDRALAVPPFGELAAAVAVAAPARLALTRPVRGRLRPPRRAALEALLGRAATAGPAPDTPCPGPVTRLLGSSARISRGTSQQTRQPVWRSFAAEQRAYVSDGPGLVGRLAAIRCPVTDVAGLEDRIVPPATARRLAAALPSADVRLVEVPGVGHLLPEDAPGELAAAVAGVAARSG